MEVGKNIISIDILAYKLDLAVALGFITTIKISKRNLEDTALKSL